MQVKAEILTGQLPLAMTFAEGTWQDCAVQLVQDGAQCSGCSGRTWGPHGCFKRRFELPDGHGGLLWADRCSFGGLDPEEGVFKELGGRGGSHGGLQLFDGTIWTGPHQHLDGTEVACRWCVFARYLDGHVRAAAS